LTSEATLNCLASVLRLTIGQSVVTSVDLTAAQLSDASLTAGCFLLVLCEPVLSEALQPPPAVWLPVVVVVVVVVVVGAVVAAAAVAAAAAVSG